MSNVKAPDTHQHISSTCITKQNQERYKTNLSFTTDRMASINIHPGMPTVITGDWNLHHNNWNSSIDKESTPTRTQEVVDWLEGQGFSLCSKRDVHTRSSTGTQHNTIIDLTFANEPAIGQGVVVHNHSVNPDLTLLSDHNALTFTLGDLRESVVNIAEAKYNWKDAIEDDFTKALNQELHADAVLYDTSIQQILNKQCTHATPEELDTTVRFINTCMEQAVEKAVPTHQMCSQLKPWWNNTLTTAFKEMRMARDMARAYYQHFNHESENMTWEAKQLHKRALNLVKIAKQEYYLKLTEDANT